MAEPMLPIVITFVDQEIGRVHVYQAKQAHQETG